MNAPADHVVITGVGLASCLGPDAGATWRAVREGRCGWGPLTALEAAGAGSCHGGQAADAPDARGASREVGYLRMVLREALRSADLEPAAVYARERCACILGTTLHGMRRGGEYLRGADTAVLEGFLAAPVMREALGGLEILGPRLTTCAACSSGLSSIGLALTLLDAGEADVVIAGGYDPLSEYAYAGFDSLRLIAPAPVRPFSADRQGMNIAEGYAILILERLSDALRRGARPLAAVRAVAGSSDCHHLTQPHPRGDGARRAIGAALKRAGIGTPQIGLIAAHGTGTPSNDAAEHAGLSAAFGDRLAEVPIVAFKSHLGHMLGGAGAAELILSALSLRDQTVPPTATVTREEAGFPGLRLNTGAARAARIEATLGLSLGFGGANSCAVLSAAPDRAGAAPSPLPRRREVLITGVGVVAPGAVGNTEFTALLSRAQGALGADPGGVSEDAIAHLLNTRRVRRMSDYVKLTLAATTVALEDAGVTEAPSFCETAAAVLGTTHGSTGFSEAYYREIVDQGMAAANPMLFAEGVPNAGAAQLSMMLQVKGSCQTLIGSRTAGLDALWLAALRIGSGQWERAIVGAGEEYAGVVNTAYERHGLYARDGPVRPFAGRGFRVGACAAAIILESAGSVAARGGRARGRVIQGGSTGGAGAVGGVSAVRRALEAAGAPDHILCSASGTWLDRVEAAGIARARRGRGAPSVSTISGYLGETFSAGPLAGVAGVLLSGRLPAISPASGRRTSLKTSDGSGGPERFAVLSTDWSGCASAVCIGVGAS